MNSSMADFKFSSKRFTFRLCVFLKLVTWILLLPVFVSQPRPTSLALGSVLYNSSLPDGTLVQHQVDLGTWSFCTRQPSPPPTDVCDNITPCPRGNSNRLCSSPGFGYTLRLGNTSESNGRTVSISTKGVAIARTLCFALLTGSLASNAFGFESSLTSVVLLALTVAGVATAPTSLRPVGKISAEWDLSITALMLGIVSCLLISGCALFSIGTLSWQFKRYTKRPQPPLRPLHWAAYSPFIRHMSSHEDPYAHYWAAADEATRRREDRCHQCNICWETKEKLVALPCHHFFCAGCIKDGLRISDGACPFCDTQFYEGREPLDVICK